MGRKIHTILVTIVIGIAFPSIVAAQNVRILDLAERTTGDRFAIVTGTARGAKVFAVRRPARAALAAIDKGLSDLFAVARKNGYRKRLNYSDYTIYIGRPDRINDADGKYSPAIAIGTAQYAGTVFDKGGYMYVAGMVLSNEPCAFLVPDHIKNFNLLSDYVRYEGEHLILYHNDRRRYAATADHSKGGSHPILQ